MMDVEQPIDAVVMWVDGSSEEFRRSEEEALAEEKRQGKPVVHSAARHRDNGELRYLLRGIEHNMPWVRHIYVVTNGQKPDYVDFSVPGISQVSHPDIFEDGASLPCFNSFAIDSYLHRIEGLSDNFLRFSDDFFVGRELAKQEFLKHHSAFILTGAVQDEPKNRYQGQVKYNADVMQKVLGVRPKFNAAHAPQLRNKAVCERFAETFAEAMTKTRNNKFRTRKDVIPLTLYPYFALYESSPEIIEQMDIGLDIPSVHVPSKAVSDRYTQVEVGKDGTNWQWKLDKVKEVRPAYFNLNDSFDEVSEEEGVKLMDEFLQEIFPKPSRYEL